MTRCGRGFGLAANARGLAIAGLLVILASGAGAQSNVRTVIKSTYARLSFDRDISKIAVADTDIAESQVIDTRQALVLGKAFGRTSVIVWFADGTSDDFTFWVQRDLSVLQRALQDIHPSIVVEAAPDRDAVVLRGRVPDFTFFRQAEAAAKAYLEAGSARRREGSPLGVSSGEGASAQVRAPLEFEPSSAVLNLISVDSLPASREDHIRSAIRLVGGTKVTVERVVRGDLLDDENDILILGGEVPDQVSLVRVLSIASRVFLGKSVGRNDIRVVADEGGALTSNGSGGNAGENSLRGFGGFDSSSSFSSGGSNNLGQRLANRVQANIGRATTLEMAEGRIISFIAVADIPQVRVNIKLFEVNRSKLAAWGADLAVLNSDFSQPPLEPAGGAVGVQNGQAFNVGSQGGTDLQNVLSFLGGSFANQFQVSGSNYAIDLLLSTLETKGLVRRLSETALSVLSGEYAVFQVGGEVPIPESFSPALGTNAAVGVFNSVGFRPFGIQLGIRPMVGENDVITLDVAPEIVNPDPTLNTVLRNSTGTDLPTTAFETRSLRTTSRLNDGQALVLGGLSNRSRSLEDSSTPGVSDLPGLNWLFSDLNSSREELELVIIVEPAIIRDPLGDAPLWAFPDAKELRDAAGLVPAPPEK